MESYSPSPCTQGEGRGEGRMPKAHHYALDPHPNPLPDYRERRSFRHRFWVGILLAVSAAGCGYHNGDSGWHWNSPYRADVKTVAVPIFTSRDYHRGVEFQLSDALVKKIE